MDQPEKKYKCELCSKIFDRKRYLDAHTKTVHNTNQQLICSVCQKKFSSAKALSNPSQLPAKTAKNFPFW
jgi:uncharacterized Zn-finger protein